MLGWKGPIPRLQLPGPGLFQGLLIPKEPQALITSSLSCLTFPLGCLAPEKEGRKDWGWRSRKGSESQAYRLLT